MSKPSFKVAYICDTVTRHYKVDEPVEISVEATVLWLSGYWDYLSHIALQARDMDAVNRIRLSKYAYKSLNYYGNQQLKSAGLA